MAGLLTWLWSVAARLLAWLLRGIIANASTCIPSTDDFPTQEMSNGMTTDSQMAMTAVEAKQLAQTLDFPADFMIGSATAAYQIEGGLDGCNWAEWERAGRNGKHRAGIACDAWNRFEADVGRMQELGLRMYRFSVDWSRIETSPGTFDEAALDRYVRWCEVLRAAGIEPMITLHHFAQPVWFDQQGGWEAPSSVETFGTFVDHVLARLAPHCSHWCTINELNGYAICGYIAGVHPPGMRDAFLPMLRCVRNMMVAHGRAVASIREASSALHSPPQITISFSHVVFLPGSGLASIALAALLNYLFNFAFLEPLVHGRLDSRFFGTVGWLLGWRDDMRALKGTIDFIGVNHYYRAVVRFGTGDAVSKQPSPTDMFCTLPFGLRLHASALAGFEKSDMGWDLTPSSMEWLLNTLYERYRLPLLVTESGIADGDEPDDRRTRYLAACLAVASRLVKRGVPLRGYLLWTLMDNFEWAEGFRPRFGLLRTDFETLERHPRQSNAVITAVTKAIARGSAASIPRCTEACTAR